jgi:tetratricopeptide (TPR) repeat protein
MLAVSFAAVFCCADFQMPEPPSSTISGVVRDGNNIPLGGALVTAIPEQSSSSSLQAQSGTAGQYKLIVSQPGGYKLSAALSGYQLGDSQEVKITEGASVRADFTLIRNTTETGSNQGAHPAPPEFEAAGVRGLIDPGGYSAPAGAAAATGVIKGIADIRRADADSTAAVENDWPCGLEPELQKAVEAAPTSAAANLKLGQFYLAHGETAQAVRFLSAAHMQNDSDDPTSKALAAAFLKAGRFDSARDLLEALIAHHDDAELHSLLARAQEGLGMFRPASENYRIADQNSPSEENRLGEGYELILAGSPKDAAPVFQAGLKKYPGSIRLLLAAGTAEFLPGNTSGALDYFLRATDLAPTNPLPYTFLSSAAAVQDAQPERVHESFKRYLKLAPNSADANYYYAMVLRKGQMQDTARALNENPRALFQRAIQIQPDFALAHFQLGSLYFDSKDYEAAIREYQITARLAPTLKEVHYRLGRSYQSVGQTALAAQEIQIFQRSRDDAATQHGTTDAGIEQFISVIALPSNEASSHKLSCP